LKILISTPIVSGVRTGNRSSADQWRVVFEELGHEVEIASSYGGQAIDWLVGLHAVKSAEAVAACREQHPDTHIALVLTGTDIYPEPTSRALEAMHLADVLVGLQPDAAEQLPPELRGKVSVIVQASAAGAESRSKTVNPFDVCVVGHLREVKDPMLTAKAARLLPAASKIRIRHAGAILDPKYEELVKVEEEENPRYQWIGQLGVDEVRKLIASCQLLVLTSLSEGAGRVIGSAISKQTPVLSTAIHGVIGLVGEDYPGLFPVGDERALAALLERAETDPEFRSQLSVACREREKLFEPQSELAAWGALLEGESQR
jgi:putative glycosyltransferase (TIGR04348 family)